MKEKNVPEEVRAGHTAGDVEQGTDCGQASGRLPLQDALRAAQHLHQSGRLALRSRCLQINGIE